MLALGIVGAVVLIAGLVGVLVPLLVMHKMDNLAAAEKHEMAPEQQALAAEVGQFFNLQMTCHDRRAKRSLRGWLNARRSRRLSESPVSRMDSTLPH